MTQLNFNAQSVAPATGQLDAIPKGWYVAVIEASEMKPTKNGDGSYLELKLNIVHGKYTNRKLYARLNLNNPNPIAQEIGYKELSAVCHATGVLQVQDSSQLHNIPIKVRVKVRKGDGEYDDNNEITAYRNQNEQVVLADDDPANQGKGPAVGAGMQMPPQQQPQQMQIPPQGGQYQGAPAGQYQQPQQQMPAQLPPQYQQQPQQQPQQVQQQPPQMAQQPWDNPPQMQQQQPQGQPQYQQPPQQYQQPQGQQQPQQGQQMQQQQPPQGGQWNGAQMAPPPWEQGQQ